MEGSLPSVQSRALLEQQQHHTVVLCRRRVSNSARLPLPLGSTLRVSNLRPHGGPTPQRGLP